jgi:SAM-dependent methyltransferase
MSDDRNPQAEQMADESMVRTLAAQADAIWPQECRLVAAYDLPDTPTVVDVGCGTGEIVHRLADMRADASILGIDIHEEHLVTARARCAAYGARVRFEPGDAFDLALPDDGSDLTLCRHLLQAVPEPERVVDELVRITRPGGRVHLLAEDYAMMHFHPVCVDTDQFWQRGPITYAEQTGSDLRSGRRMFTELRRLGLEDIRVDYVVVDTTRVPRETFADIWIAWRDGYGEAIAAHTSLSLEQVLEAFATMIDAIQDPDGYAVWHIPVVSGRLPTAE